MFESGDVDLGARSWGLIYAAILLLAAWIGRRIASCCVSNQRNRLRDDYEFELIRGGQLTNKLLLPGYPR